MGNEHSCTVLYDGKSFSGKALLETSELIFRGEISLKIAFNSITALTAGDGKLHVRTKGALVVFHLGPLAEKWRGKIANPKSVVEKLGVKAGQSVSCYGEFPPEFLKSLEKSGCVVAKARVTKATAWIFLAVREAQGLSRLSVIRKSIRGATALWIVYPKGQKSITEADVRSAGLKAGLVDVKVVRFSDTHTGLKFVLPLAKR